MNAPEHGMADGCAGNAAPYVLGALDDVECEAFVRHLQSCAVCREEVTSLQVVADSLPGAAPRLSAPSQLKSRVMAAVEADQQVQQGIARTPPSRRRASRSGLVRRPAFALAALAATVAVAAVAVLGGGGANVRVIRAQVIAPHASASVRLSGTRAELSVAGMPQPAAGRVYEVWVKRTGAPQPTDALFSVSAAGRATVAVPGGVAGVRQILVTSEPSGGSRVPTRAPVIVASLG